MPRLRHFDHLSTARFVTFSCYRRYRLLTDPSLIQMFLNELDALRTKCRLKYFGYVIMPEHLHLVCHPPDGLSLGRVVGELKSRSARPMLAMLHATYGRRVDRLQVVRRGRQRLAFWQARCYDHNCRMPETVMEKIRYCHKNPVVRGLVTDPGNWVWSSNHWYEGRRDVPLAMDELDT
jgi:putative transposase